MREFFLVSNGSLDKFTVFSQPHLIVLVSLSILILCIVIFRKSLSQRADFYRYLIVVIGLIIECASLVWVICAGKWDLKTSLPLELCEVTLMLCIVMLIRKSYILFEVAYFWGFIGSTLALIFPSLRLSYRHFPFWAFILTHSLNIISLVFMISIEKYKPTRKSIRLALIITNIYMLLTAAINYFLGSNYFYRYIFSKPAPNIPSPFVYAHSWFSKILMLEAISFIALLFCYLPYPVAKVFKSRTNSNTGYAQ